METPGISHSSQSDLKDQSLIRAFRHADGPACWSVFVNAVRIGAAGYYTPDELLEGLPDDALPDGYADWLAGEFTVVGQKTGQITGFMMMRSDGYLDLAFVMAAKRRTGLADRLHSEILTEARARGLTRLTTLASRLAERFFARQSWTLSPDPLADPGPNPMSRPMQLDLP